MRLMPWLSLFVLAAGCGPSRGNVSGQISYHGRPMMQGTVQAVPADKIIRYASIENGAYQLRDLPAGSAHFAVSSPDPRAQRVAARASSYPAKDKAEATTVVRAEKWIPIPEKYASFETSGLHFDIRAGENHYEIVLSP